MIKSAYSLIEPNRGATTADDVTQGPQLMDLQPKRNGSNGSEALEPVELPLFEKSHHALYPHLAAEHSSLLHYWRILRKRKWVMLATFTIVFALSAIAVLSETRIYQATSKVAIFPEVPNVLGFKDIENSSPDYEYEATLETQVAILRSDALALKVIEAMRLYQDPRFAPVTQSLPDSSMPGLSMQPDPTQAAGLLGAFHSGLNVQLVPSTRLIQVNYIHSDPRFATEITNTLVKTFIEENFRTKYDSASQTSDWLSRELADLQLKVQTSEEKLVRYQKDHGILGVDEKQNIVTEKLGELNKELTEAQTDRIEKEADYRLAMNGDPASFTRATPDGRTTGVLLDKLREKEADLETQYAMATTQFGSGYPKVTELSNQLKQVRAAIEAEKTKMQEKMRDEYLGAAQRESLLESAFNQQKQEANKLNESAIEYTVLKRDAETNRQLYQDLLQRLKEAGVSAGLRSSNIRIVDIARIPTQPISPNVHRSLVLGFLLGLSLAIGLALVLESFDNTVRSIEEIRTVSTLPALGTIPLQLVNGGPLRKRTLAISPDVEQSGMIALVTYERPRSEAAEAYRALRTSILLSSFGAPPKVILVTSAMPQEGKTTISANSALVLAQRGSRVLLIDADLRRPGIEKMFGLMPHSSGLSTLISGSSKVEDAVFPCPEVPNLWILPAGPIPPQPAELLGSTVMKEHIAHWRNEFDHIIIDTPPCLSVTDAVLLSPEADRVILVARSGQTTKPALRRACDLLLQVNARVMGIVLNALNHRSGEGYYYYTGRYSNHYYSEESADNKQPKASKVS
jgi:succinoglycan biosynthesis transport protein ExoP